MFFKENLDPSAHVDDRECYRNKKGNTEKPARWRRALKIQEEEEEEEEAGEEGQISRLVTSRSEVCPGLEDGEQWLDSIDLASPSSVPPPQPYERWGNRPKEQEQWE